MSIKINSHTPASPNPPPATPAPINHLQVFEDALGRADHSAAYDFSRQIQNDQERYQKTSAVTQIWINRNDLDTLASHLTAHVLAIAPQDSARSICDFHADERYTIAFNLCENQEQLDNLIVKILTIFMSRSHSDYSHNSYGFCNREPADCAAFAKACLNHNNDLLERVFTDSKFSATEDIFLSFPLYLFMKYDSSELNQDSISNLEQITNETFKDNFNRGRIWGTRAGFLINFYDYTTEQNKSKLDSFLDNHGKSFFTQDFLNALCAKNDLLFAHAYRLANSTS